MSTNPSTATEARHAHPYDAACDMILAYTSTDEPSHAYRGDHSLPYDFAAEEAANAIWCIEASPLVPWPKHLAVAA